MKPLILRISSKQIKNRDAPAGAQVRRNEVKIPEKIIEGKGKKSFCVEKIYGCVVIGAGLRGEDFEENSHRNYRF